MYIPLASNRIDRLIQSGEPKPPSWATSRRLQLHPIVKNKRSRSSKFRSRCSAIVFSARSKESNYAPTIH